MLRRRPGFLRPHRFHVEPHPLALAAIVVLVVQGLLTALAKPLRKLAERPELAAEATSSGGMILIAIGVSLLGLRDERIPTEVFLPALVIAPLISPLFHKGSGNVLP